MHLVGINYATAEYWPAARQQGMYYPLSSYNGN
jgi:hypothetical protein